MLLLALIAYFGFANGLDYMVAFPDHTIYGSMGISSGSGYGSYSVNFTDGTSESRSLNPYNSARYYIDAKWSTSLGIEDKGVLVSVLGKPGEEGLVMFMGGQAYKPLPVTDLGRRYILVFCELTTLLPEVTFVVIATDDNTKVTIKFNTASQVWYDGRHYKNNDDIQITLMKQQTFSLSTDTDLTGTSVTGDKNVVVLAGTGNFNITRVTFEQLLPTRYFGREYIVPTFPPGTHKVRVVSDHSKYDITYGNNTKRAETNSALGPVPYIDPYYFTTSEGVMVAVCWDEKQDSMVIIPPVKSFVKTATLDWINENFTVMVVAPQGEVNDIVARQQDGVVNTIEWQGNPAASTSYKYGFLKWNTSSSVVITTTQPNSANFFTVYDFYTDPIYGFIYNGGYNFDRLEKHSDEHGENTHVHATGNLVKLHKSLMIFLLGFAFWIQKYVV